MKAYLRSVALAILGVSAIATLWFFGYFYAAPLVAYISSGGSPFGPPWWEILLWAAVPGLAALLLIAVIRGE